MIGGYLHRGVVLYFNKIIKLRLQKGVFFILGYCFKGVENARCVRQPVTLDIDRFESVCSRHFLSEYSAEVGSASVLGTEGREFNSHYSDQK
jgi:hypothetical protein